MAVFKPSFATYRISEVAHGASADDVRNWFPLEERELITKVSHATSLHHTGKRLTQVFIVTFAKEPQSLRTVHPQGDPKLLHNLLGNLAPQFPEPTIDSSFEGLTPLTDGSGSSSAIDVIAVTGLAGRPFGSWQCEDGSMWLRDFLPRDLENHDLRVMTYGYLSKVVGSNSHATLGSFTEDFLQRLESYRGQSYMERRRPLILVGHSLGAIIVKHAWIRCTEATSVTTQAVSRPSATNFLEELKLAISGLVLFGAPHDGMEVGALRTAAEGHPSLTLVEEMDPRSSIIKDLKERFTKAIGQLRVISCFEELETPTLRRLDDGTFERDGTKMMMVPERSACLFWPHDSEIRIKIRADHSKIAKLSSTVESKYHIIKDEIAKVADAALRHIPNRFARADICNTMDHICALLDFIDKSMSTSSVGHQLHANLKSLRGTADAVRRTVLDPLLGEVFLGPHKSRDFIATFTTRSNELEAIFFDYDRLALMSDVAYQRYAQFSYHPSTMMSTRMPLMTASETDALLAPRAVQDLCDRASAIMQILIQNFSFSMLHSPVNLDLLKNHTHTQELGLPRIAELQRLFQSEEDFNLTPLGGTLSTSSESGIVVGRWRGGAQATTVIVEYKQYSRSPPATLSADEAQYVTSARLRAQKLVALLQKCSEFSEDPERARSGVGSMTYTFRCLGYLEQLEDRRLAVLYEVPDKYAMQDGQLPGNMLTLKTMIEKGLKVPLEERFHLAVKICSTILNLHSLGWLHKSIRSEHVVVFLSSASKYTKDLPGLPSSYSERCEIYLKGFEFSREVVEKSDPFEVPRDDDLYRHPDRQGVPSVQFTKEYDIYAVGLLLLEIGMGATLAYWAQKLRSKVDKGNNRTTPHGYRLAFIKLAKDNLKNIMGTRYARAVQKCLEGDFGVRMDDKQQTALGIAFQNQVLREIAYGLSL